MSEEEKKVEWEEPGPSSGRFDAKYTTDLLRLLSENPGKWALHRTEFSSQNSAVSSGLRFKKSHGLEYTTRGNRLYLRAPLEGDQ